MARSEAAPYPADLTHLRPTDGAGLRIVAIASAGTVLGLMLSFAGGWGMWLCGQGLLALMLVQWFVILHECGHETLFRTRRWHAAAGRLAATFSLIPYHSLDPRPRTPSQVDRLAGSRSDDRVAGATTAGPCGARARERLLAALDPAVLRPLPQQQLLEHSAAACGCFPSRPTVAQSCVTRQRCSRCMPC